jgi:hypothetical protein
MTETFKPKKSWKEKVETDCAATFAAIPPVWEKKMGVGQMVITSPKLMYDLVIQIPKGSLVLQDEIRRKFASDFKVQTTCPMTTGIFLRIAAEAAEEYRSEGAKKIAPYWRVVKENGMLNEKFPGGTEGQKALLEKEGFTIVTGKKKNSLVVKDFERSLMIFE